MKKEKRSLFFKEDMEIAGQKYLSGYAYELELEPYKFDRLTRQGCIYAEKDAKYYKEEKPQKPAKKSRRKRSEVEENVDHKEDSKQTEVQADDTLQG